MATKKGSQALRMYVSKIRQAVREGKVEDGLALLREMLSLGHQPPSFVFSHVLYLLETQGPSRFGDVQELMKVMKEQNVQPEEAFFTTLIRFHLAMGNPSSAREVLGEMMKAENTLPKRRTFLPVLEAVCEGGNEEEAFKMLTLMRELGIVMGESEFIYLVKLCSFDYARHRMPEVLEEMRQVLYGIQQPLAEELRNWFEKTHNVSTGRITEFGMCSVCQARLGIVDVKEEQVARMCEDLEKMIQLDLDGKSNSHELALQDNVFRTGTPQGLRGGTHFKTFKAWLEKNGPWDVIVDGANVGYYGQSGNQRRDLQLNYHQIDRVIRSLQRRGHSVRVLLILHAQHIKKARHNPDALKMVERWLSEGIIYVTPSGMNDDWFWIYAGLWSTRKLKSTLILSNDGMQDHHYALVETSRKFGGEVNSKRMMADTISYHKEFLKWKERHWVTYEWSRSVGRIVFNFPLPYSTCIQGSLAQPSPSSSSSSSSSKLQARKIDQLITSALNTKLEDVTWHFPIATSTEEELEDVPRSSKHKEPSDQLPFSVTKSSTWQGMRHVQPNSTLLLSLRRSWMLCSRLV
ncbi:hypothetical protein GUITHDRAFT_145271 [Guillardia theta CCMP2712]|uniref:Mitochondrial ribonuclease P catalytic subunit n=1 Tax=Guillardia theta (strain CCMP2712) TaxID=905079 RepID=L1IMI8_GUITC|nr:hypothetical protein GUITHDRAFT_145271 [Guillardia theta CCMP2712]EKX37025.1 hypothetical protein GUITHDRAFT_145271 [Guillardia theta CCMP2712]|eukprot:XP_005824005.1 hypothetical protein GUITHDRAFT_145271 [Guillardia theta CCMP2712]